MQPRLIFLTLLLSFSFSFGLARDANLEAGWEAFAQNNLNKAKMMFGAALSGPDAPEAHLGLSLVAASMGDSEVSFDHYYQYYQTAADPEADIRALWMSERGLKSDQQLEFYETLAKKAQSSQLRALAAQQLGFHYMAKGDMDEADTYFEKIGAIEQWQILGEFENISESGFDRDFGVLAHPESEHIFTNKRGVDIQWFDLKMPTRSKWIDFEYHFYTSNSMMYAQTFCTSPEEREVQFRVGVSGSLKIWVNDQLQFSEAQERDNGIDSYVFRTKLAAGTNRILVQVGSSETSGSNFLLRITDEEGNLFEDLQYSTQLADYPGDYTYESERVPDPVELEMQARIAADPDWLPNYVGINQFYLMGDNVYQAKQYLKLAKEHFPDCSYVTFQLFLASARDDNETESSTYLEEVKAKDPNSPLALSLTFNEAMDIEDFDEAEEILEKIEANEGLSVNVYLKKMELASNREQMEALFALVKEGYQAYPEESEFARLSYLIEKDVRKDSRQARKILEQYLKRYYDENIMLTLINHYLSVGQVSSGLELFQELLEDNPLATGFYSRLSSIYFSLGRYEKAEELVQECIRIAPYVGSYHKSLGESYREMGKIDRAISAFEKAIYYDPYDYEVREQLRQLNDEGDVFDEFQEIKLERIIASAPDAGDFPDDHSIILLDEVQKVVYPGGGSEMKQHLIVKVFNSDGVDAWKEYNVTVTGNQQGFIEKAEVIKANGSRLEAQNQRGYIVFPNLEPGDAIHLSYRVQDYFSGKLVGQFWDSHYFSLSLPIQTSRYSLLVPEDREFQYVVSNSDLEPIINRRGSNRLLYIWERFDVPAIKLEPYMSQLPDVEPVLYISSFEDWDFIADWYADLAQAKAKSDFVVQETVAELFEGKEGLSDREIVQSIYDYIITQIRYRSVPFLQSGLVPQKASAVISSKQGDCKDVSTLFVAMAEEMGINAHLVLINTRDNGQNSMPLPSIDFNHCIAKVNLDGQDYFVELTADNLPFSSGTRSIKRTFALEIPRGESRSVTGTVINPSTRVPNTVQRSSEVSFEGSDLIVEKNSIKSGVMATFIRDIYENLGDTQRAKEMQEAINGEYPNIKLIDLNFGEDLYDNSDRVEYQYSYRAPSIFMQVGGMSIFKLPWSDALESGTPEFLATETRLYPIELWRYSNAESWEETLYIHPPEGKQFSELPEPVIITHPNAEYELSFSFDEETQVLTAVRHFAFTDDIVKPADYPAFKTFMGQVIKADEIRLAVVDKE